MAGVSPKSDADCATFTSQLFDAFKGNNALLQQFYSNLLIKSIQQQQHQQQRHQQQPFDGLCFKNRNSPVPTMVYRDSALTPVVSRSPDEATQSSPDTDLDEKPRKRQRIRGQSVKTAEVWKYFVQIHGEQAATCTICQKTIKATNSSTTGMIRHLRSCHNKEHELLQNARRENYLRKGLKNGVLDDHQLSQLAVLERFKEISNLREEQQLKHDSLIHDSDTTSDLVDSITSASTSSVLSDSDMKPLHTIDRLVDSSDKLTDSGFAVSDTSSDQHDSTDATDESMDKLTLQMEVNDRLASIFSCKILPVEVVDNPQFRKFFHILRPELSLGFSTDFREIIDSDADH